jgi:hypothetical protein
LGGVRESIQYSHLVLAGSWRWRWRYRADCHRNEVSWCKESDISEYEQKEVYLLADDHHRIGG